MAYTEPPAWAHGQADTNLAAGLNTIAGNLAHFATAHPGYAGVTSSGSANDTLTSDSENSITHRRAHRWLVYSASDNDDPVLLTLLHAEVTSKDFSTSLESSEEVAVMYMDLDSIDWLLPGMAYTVRNVSFAFESDLEGIDA